MNSVSGHNGIIGDGLNLSPEMIKKVQMNYIIGVIKTLNIKQQMLAFPKR